MVADARTTGREAILAIVGQVYDERPALRRQLERKMPEVRETVLDLFAVHNSSRIENKPLKRYACRFGLIL